MKEKEGKLKGRELYHYCLLNVIMLVIAVSGLVDKDALNSRRNYILYGIMALVALIMVMENISRLKDKIDIRLSILFLLVEIFYISVMISFFLFPALYSS